MKRYWLSFLLSLLILASVPKFLNAQVNSTLPQQNQTTSVGITINLAGILAGIAAIIAAIKSSKQAEKIKQERVKIQQDLLSTLDSEEKIQQFSLYLKEVLLSKDTEFRKELERIIQHGQAGHIINLVEKMVSTYVKQGDDSCSIGQYQKAIDNYQQALELKPKDSEILHKLGNTYASLKQYKKGMHPGLLDFVSRIYNSLITKNHKIFQAQ